jgi:hypothetical protein
MVPALDELIHAVDNQGDHPLARLEAASATAAQLEQLGDALLNHFVDRCRQSGHTWAEIGQHLGVTRQAVQKRFINAAGDVVTFERFTMRARAALDRTREIARELQHNYCGTEHLLLALFDIEGGLAAEALRRLGIERAWVEGAVLERLGRGSVPVGDDPPWTPRARRVLREALNVSADLGHNYVGTEHLLLALERDQEGLAKRILSRLGAEPAQIRDLVVEMLSGFRREPST